MVLQVEGAGRLAPVDRPRPVPRNGQVLMRVEACGVCRTDLHLVDGELPQPKIPVVPGHEIVGRVLETGDAVTDVGAGERVGVPWLGGSCDDCRYCTTGRENLCASARFTGYQLDGGYAEYAVADQRYVFALPDDRLAPELAPWLCAGLIGYRAYRLARRERADLERLGLYGFGAAAHIVCQMACHDGLRVFAFTRPQDEPAQCFAESLGAEWAGGSDGRPPHVLDAAIVFAPVGALVPAALQAVGPAGVVVCAGIHMSDIPSFPYRWLWQERVVRSLANLTRRDAREFLERAAHVPLRTRSVEYPLSEANRALDDLRHGRFQGVAVLVPDVR